MNEEHKEMTDYIRLETILTAPEMEEHSDDEEGQREETRMTGRDRKQLLNPMKQLPRGNQSHHNGPMLPWRLIQGPGMNNLSDAEMNIRSISPMQLKKCLEQIELSQREGSSWLVDKAHETDENDSEVEDYQGGECLVMESDNSQLHWPNTKLQDFEHKHGLHIKLPDLIHKHNLDIKLQDLEHRPDLDKDEYCEPYTRTNCVSQLQALPCNCEELDDTNGISESLSTPDDFIPRLKLPPPKQYEYSCSNSDDYNDQDINEIVDDHTIKGMLCKNSGYNSLDITVKEAKPCTTQPSAGTKSLTPLIITKIRRPSIHDVEEDEEESCSPGQESGYEGSPPPLFVPVINVPVVIGEPGDKESYYGNHICVESKHTLINSDREDTAAIIDTETSLPCSRNIQNDVKHRQFISIRMDSGVECGRSYTYSSFGNKAGSHQSSRTNSESDRSVKSFSSRHSVELDSGFSMASVESEQSNFDDSNREYKEISIVPQREQISITKVDNNIWCDHFGTHPITCKQSQHNLEGTCFY